MVAGYASRALCRLASVWFLGGTTRQLEVSGGDADVQSCCCCSSIRHRWKNVGSNINPSLWSFTVEVERARRPMAAVVIWCGGKDNFSLAILLI